MQGRKMLSVQPQGPQPPLTTSILGLAAPLLLRLRRPCSQLPGEHDKTRSSHGVSSSGSARASWCLADLRFTAAAELKQGLCAS